VAQSERVLERDAALEELVFAAREALFAGDDEKSVMSSGYNRGGVVAVPRPGTTYKSDFIFLRFE
jgi:hypothetical protein